MTRFDKQRKRLADIFGTDDVPAVKTETLERYLDHLKQHLEFPCQLTGIEDFPWEEVYIIGPGDKEEHEELRQTQPSYLDTYELLSFGDITPRSGIRVNVRRVSDQKTFVLPLADLETTNKKSKNYELLDIVARFHATERRDPRCRYVPRYRGRFLYLDREDYGHLHPICRLAYTGKMDDWSFAIYKYSDERYDDQEWFFPGSGHVDGTIEGAMKAGFEAYPA